MIGYVTVGANDLPRAHAFYDALLGGELGATRLIDNAESHGFVMWGTGWTQPGFAVARPHDGRAAAPGNGTMSAFVVSSRAKVDAFHARALALGGSDEGRPACAVRRVRRPSTAPTSAIPKATSSPCSASARPEPRRAAPGDD